MRRLALLPLLLVPFLVTGNPAPAGQAAPLHLHPVLAQKSDLMPAGTHATNVPRHLSAAPLGPIDLSQWAVPILDQGQVGACAAFSTTSLRWWYLYHDTGGRPADTFAPEFQYARIARGKDEGSTLDDNFNIQVNDGTEPLHSYSYGTQAALYDFTDQPVASDYAAAAAYKTTAWHYVVSDFGPNNAAVIDAELHQGHPVEIGIAVYGEWMFYKSGVIGPHSASSMLYGYHAIVLYGEDTGGNFIGQNQWGDSQWGIAGPTGQGGWFKISRSFANKDTFAATVIDGVSNPIGPQPTDTPGPSPTAAPTQTPAPTDTPAPTSTPRPARTPNPTASPTGTTEPTALPTATLPPPPPPPPAPTATPKPGRWQCKGTKSTAWAEHLCRWRAS